MTCFSISIENMKKATKLLIILACTCVWFGCQDKGQTFNPVNYMRYLEDPGNLFKRTVKTGNCEYTTQLATPEYMTIREFADALATTPDSVFQKRLKEREGYIFFLIRIKETDMPESVAGTLVKKTDAERMVMYYQGEAANDLKLIVNDSVYKTPSAYLFENNYSLVNYNTIVVGFRQSLKEAEIELKFNDQYHNNLFIKTSFSKEELKRLPVLSL